MPNEVRTFAFSDRSGEYKVEIWCDGRHYDHDAETYRPVYSYRITSPRWVYDANDIYGAASEVPNLAAASQSLFAFLYASQEGMLTSGRLSRDNENADMFPRHVREWAYNFSEQLELLHHQIVKEIESNK